jgi:urease accessory protein
MELPPAREVVVPPLPRVPYDVVVLAHDERALRRRRLVTAHDEGFLVDLSRTVRVAGGAAFRLEDGRLVEVIAAEERLWEVRGDLPRLAWHVGNRHAACEVWKDHLRVLREPVMGRMLEGLGARLSEVSAPFEPEGGAYSHDSGDGLEGLGDWQGEGGGAPAARTVAVAGRSHGGVSRGRKGWSARGGTVDAEALLILAQWLSPAYPTGAFAWSHGLEAAVAMGLVADAAELEAWIGDLVAWGSGRSDAILLGAAYRAGGRSPRRDRRSGPCPRSVLGALGRDTRAGRGLRGGDAERLGPGRA